MPKVLKVLHVITGLESGGAEMVLCRLVAGMNRTRFENRVVSLTSRGPILGRRIESEGTPVRALGFRRGVPDPRLVPRVAGEIRRFRPDVVQTWLYQADLVGALAARLISPNPPVVWGIHLTDADPRTVKRSTRMTIWLNARLASRLPARIVCCVEAARDIHRTMGFPDAKMTVIPNGMNTDEFAPSETARCAVRQELGLPIDAPLIGLVARFDPQKDHETFLRAAGLLHAVRPDVHFLLCGTNVTPDNAELTRWAAEAKLDGTAHFLGLRQDTARMMAALDVGTSASAYGEALPLAIGEAMAAGTPCVVTDLPGPASLVGDTGRIVPKRNSQALADAWREILEMPEEERRLLGARARQRIQENYSLDAMINAYENLYLETAR